MKHHTCVILLLACAILILMISCDSSTDSNTGCKNSFDCNYNEKCVDNQCLTVCEEDSDCKENERCEDEACIKISSDGDNEQTDGDNPLPDGDNNTDGDSTDGDTDEESPQIECTSSAQCNLGNICVQNKCVAGCESVRDCPDDMQCKPDAGDHGLCVDCILDNDCEESEKCVNNICLHVCTSDADCSSETDAPYCDESGICVECLADSNCDLGNICAGGSCVEGCRGDRDCESPLVCDPEYGDYGSCFECVANTNCDTNKICKDHTCVMDCSVINCPDDRPYCIDEDGSCVECTEKNHCSTGEVCSDFNYCVEGCETDEDCRRGEYCKANGTGSCVECLNDSHCEGEAICASNVCTQSGCNSDEDCTNSQYCHPNTRECTNLPAGFCVQDADCHNILIQDVCDPLTRKCISSCLTLGFCVPLDGSNRWMCIDDGCYECSSNTNCYGTYCRPFDNMCEYCESDSDCVNSSYHCELSSGECHECLENSHCSNGEKCYTADNICVECLQDSDCTNSAFPECSKSHTCIAPCVDDCTEDEIKCNDQDEEQPIGYLACADVDDDSCLDWTSPRSCSDHRTCKNDECVCYNECQEGDAYCDSEYPTTVYYCDENTYGCWYYTYFVLSDGTTCEQYLDSKKQ